MSGRFPYEQRIENDRVHGSLYTDERVFADELQTIWARAWLAVGHESEVPEPGDYVVKRLGAQPVILARGEDRTVRLLLNRCSHRGNQVCEAQRGNSRAFRCPYHGWTFSNTGELLGFPYNGGYGRAVDKDELGLGRVPRVAVHQGFVFASFAGEGPTLAEHLGNAAEVLDRVVSFSPQGRVELTTGWLRHRVNANWKLVVENETDGYHPGFVHKSIIAAADTPLTVYTEKSTALVRDLGGGHTELDVRPEHRRAGRLMRWCASSEDRDREYVEAMRAVHGRERADRLLIEGPPHAMIWPNLFISENFLLIIEPVSVSRSIQYSTPLLFAGAPSLNRRALRQFEGSVGPAGMLLADDSAMYERNQNGLRAADPEWLILRRGLHREQTQDGQRWSNVTDETSQRAIWRRYREAVTASGQPG
jgi:phenylpropionate dioxygenase-like ring-hydroxylating dioxygenase large terminal subunit